MGAVGTTVVLYAQCDRGNRWSLRWSIPSCKLNGPRSIVLYAMHMTSWHIERCIGFRDLVISVFKKINQIGDLIFQKHLKRITCIHYTKITNLWLEKGKKIFFFSTFVFFVQSPYEKIFRWNLVVHTRNVNIPVCFFLEILET